MAVNSEREILDRVRGSMRGKGTGLALGIGDDCAIYRPRPGEELLFTTDLLIEDVHFRRATHSARDIGYKALARATSDVSLGWPICSASAARWPWSSTSTAGSWGS